MAASKQASRDASTCALIGFQFNRWKDDIDEVDLVREETKTKIQAQQDATREVEILLRKIADLEKEVLASKTEHDTAGQLHKMELIQLELGKKLDAHLAAQREAEHVADALAKLEEFTLEQPEAEHLKKLVRNAEAKVEMLTRQKKEAEEKVLEVEKLKKETKPSAKPAAGDTARPLTRARGKSRGQAAVDPGLPPPADRGKQQPRRWTPS